MGCGLAHAPGSAAGAEPPALAAKCHQHLMFAALAPSSEKSVSQDPAVQVLGELFGHEVWQWVARVVQDLILEGEPVVLDQFVEKSLFWLVPCVGECFCWSACI